ncbi:UbiD family decarboxylase [Chloroflexota bacterium]
MSKDMRHFLQLAKEAGPDYYVEVKHPLKTGLELNVLQLKLAYEGRFPIIYCPRVEGSNLPLVSNIFGSYQLLALALGMDAKTATKAKILREYRMRRDDVMPVQVVSASEAPVKEVIMRGDNIDLGILPINHHAELDSGKYITIGHMVCKDPDSGILNVGVYRHEVKGKKQLGAVLIKAHHASYIAGRYAERNGPMEVALFIGHHPAVAFGSLSMGGIDVKELELIGGILGEPLQVTQAETVDLPVPSRAEIVIEGTIDQNNTSTDGPLAEWLGYYGEQRDCNLIEVSCITMRKDAIYHDLAPAQQEHNFAGVFGKTGAVYDAVKSVVPTVKEVYLPPSGRSNIMAYVSIAKRVPGEPKRAALAAVNSMDTIGIAVVVDDDIDVYNEEELLWAIATRMTPDVDITIIPGMLGCPLNPMSYDETRLKKGLMNTKMIIDATKPLESPFPTRVTPPKDLWESMKLEDYIK